MNFFLEIFDKYGILFFLLIVFIFLVITGRAELRIGGKR